MIRNLRQPGDDSLLIFQFRIEHAEGIRLNPPLTVRPQLVFHLQQFRAQQFHILRPALAIPNRINLQLHALEAEPREKCHHHLNHFRVHSRVFSDIFRRILIRRNHLQHFRPNLIKLPVSSLLRPLPPEHRPRVPELHRLR